jgi:hypothetical protein
MNSLNGRLASHETSISCFTHSTTANITSHDYDPSRRRNALLAAKPFTTLPPSRVVTCNRAGSTSHPWSLGIPRLSTQTILLLRPSTQTSPILLRALHQQLRELLLSHLAGPRPDDTDTRAPTRPGSMAMRRQMNSQSSRLPATSRSSSATRAAGVSTDICYIASS